MQTIKQQTHDSFSIKKKPSIFHILSFLSFLSRDTFKSQPNNYVGVFWENISAKAPSEITGGPEFAFFYNLLICE